MNPDSATDATPDTKPAESNSTKPPTETTQPSLTKNSIPFPSIEDKPKMASNTSDHKDFSLSSYSTIVKLTSSTFNDWKLRLTTVLGAQRLSKYILKDIPVPTDPTELDEHKTNSLRALAAIHSTIDDENFQVIRSCSSPRDAFKALCKHHDDAGGLSTAHLFSDLVTLKLNPDKDLSDHIAKFRKIHNDLLSNLSSTPDCKISEPFIAVILIKSLPSEYTPLVQSLLSNLETLTLARLYSLLKIEATRNAPASHGDTALSANRQRTNFKSRAGRRNDRNANNSSSNSNLKCSLGHPGHTDEDFQTRKFRAFLKQEKESASSSSHLANTSVSAQLSQSLPEADEDVLYWESAFSATVSSSAPIICDTGATNHMFSDSSLLSDLTHTRPTRIGVASQDGAIWAKHKGTVRYDRQSGSSDAT